MEIYPSNGFLSWIFNANVQAIVKYRWIMKKKGDRIIRKQQLYIENRP